MRASCSVVSEMVSVLEEGRGGGVARIKRGKRYW